MLFKLNVGTVSGENIDQPKHELPPSIVVNRIAESLRIVTGDAGRVISYRFEKSDGGDWDAETIVVATIDIPSATWIDEVCRCVAVYARQDCVASIGIDDETIEGLTFHPNYSGQEFSFDPAYFIK